MPAPEPRREGRHLRGRLGRLGDVLAGGGTIQITSADTNDTWPVEAVLAYEWGRRLIGDRP